MLYERQCQRYGKIEKCGKKTGKKNKEGEEVESEKIKSRQERKKERGRIFT